MTAGAAELIKLLDAQPKPECAALTPFTIIDADLERGFVRLEFAAQPAFRNHFGHIQGGFAVAMLDAAVSIAAYARLRQWLPTVEMKSSFLEPIAIGPCIGEGQVIKVGRSVAFLESRLLSARREPAVVASATALIPPTTGSASSTPL